MVRILAPGPGVTPRAVGRRLALLCVGAVVAVGGQVTPAAPAAAVASRTVAFYSLDEAAGAAVLSDDSGNGHDGAIGTDVTTGVVHAGATVHRFATHLPADGAFPGHVNRIPHTGDLNPDSGDFSIEVRLRTSYPFGNILQKGQGATIGGYWKLENPAGKPRCLFRGASGASRTGYSKVEVDDGQWHTIRCNRTSSYVEMYVDGVRQSRLNGSTGSIANTWGLTLGGKGDCDGVEVTCDYFVGDIDWVRVQKGSGGPANVPPAADLQVACAGLACALDAGGSADPDGAIQRHVWDFGDGQTYDGASVPTAAHAYAAAGTYQVSLTVTDDRGATDSAVQQVVVAPVPEALSYVGGSTSNLNALGHAVTVPAGVEPGDLLLLFVSQNTQAAVTGPTGDLDWTALGSRSGGYARTSVWRAVAGADAAGTAVGVSFGSITKANVVLVAYRGADPVDPVAAVDSAADPVSSAVRVTPSVTVVDPQSWAVSYWMHGDSTTSALAAPPGLVVRSNGSQTDGGRVTGLLADTAATVPPGPYGGQVATAAAASTTTTTWTVVLRPAAGASPVDQPPTAAFEADCTGLVCALDATGSSDPEGALASYAWDLGDGSGSTDGPTTAHTYAAAGTYRVSLTVTDAAGQSAGLEQEVVVADTPGEPSEITFIGAAAESRTSSTHSVTVPAEVRAGDTLVLVLALASVQAVTDPAGWQQLGAVDDGSLRAVVWSRTAEAGDPGTGVAVPVGSWVKGSLTIAGYRGVDLAGLVAAGLAQTGDSAVRTTPVLAVAAPGSWAVSFWAHRDSSTTALVPPAEVVPRAAATQSGGGRVTTLLADAGSVPTGDYGGLVATATAPSSYGVGWTVVLPPAG